MVSWSTVTEKEWKLWLAWQWPQNDQIIGGFMGWHSANHVMYLHISDLKRNPSMIFVKFVAVSGAQIPFMGPPMKVKEACFDPNISLRISPLFIILTTYPESLSKIWSNTENFYFEITFGRKDYPALLVCLLIPASVFSNNSLSVMFY